MTKNKKLRLLVTKECHNNCPKCCNKQYDLDAVPVIDRFDYDEICITGGEPMLCLSDLVDIAITFKTLARCQGKPSAKVYIYTACMDVAMFNYLGQWVDGFVYTPHTDRDLSRFIYLNNAMLRNAAFHQTAKSLSLRLNLFADVKEKLKNEDLSLWKVKEMDWQDDCPVPDGEDFRRLYQI